MKVAFDAGVLGLVLFPSGPIPNDFRTGLQIDKARERVESLIDELNGDTDEIILPSPALAEALVPVAKQIEEVVKEIEDQRCFNIAPFDKKAAIELAIRTKNAVDAGDKKEGIDAPWQKIKYDRQIIAIAKAEGASVLYSVDEDVHKHGKLWGLQVLSVADIAIPTPTGKPGDLFEGNEGVDDVDQPQGSEVKDAESKGANASPAPVPGSPAGPTEGKAGAEASEANGEIEHVKGATASQSQKEVVPESETPASTKPAGE